MHPLMQTFREQQLAEREEQALRRSSSTRGDPWRKPSMEHGGSRRAPSRP